MVVKIHQGARDTESNVLDISYHRIVNRGLDVIKIGRGIDVGICVNEIVFISSRKSCVFRPKTVRAPISRRPGNNSFIQTSLTVISTSENFLKYL